ncbi:hypothetical protein [Lonepinella sp. MS14435]|uniref:hypothetical protein n=1 Tax=Lonepinella sp. MS14435 TaxID=3003618 RepID=UPI0036DD6CDB
MKSIRFYLFLCWLLFSIHGNCFSNVFIEDNTLYLSKIDNSYLKLDIIKSSDDDILNVEINNTNNRIDIYSSNSSNSSYYVFSIKYDDSKKSFIQDRIEYVVPCSYCNDLRTEYCSMYQSKDISLIDFSEVNDRNFVCYFTYEGETKGIEFNTLDKLVKAFDSNRQYMKSFSCHDFIKNMNRFSFKEKDNFDEYKKILNLLEEENEYSLLSCISSYFDNKKGIVRSKNFLYANPSITSKTKSYLVSGDIVSILDEKNISGRKWYFINYKGKKDINMWIKAEAVDFSEKE